MFYDQTGTLTGLGVRESRQVVFDGSHCNCDVEPHFDDIGRLRTSNEVATLFQDQSSSCLSFLMGDTKGRLQRMKISDDMAKRLSKNRRGSPYRPKKCRRKTDSRTSPRRGARRERGWTSHGDRDSSTATTNFTDLITVLSETEENSYSHHGRVNCITSYKSYLATGGQDKSIVLFQDEKYVDTLFGHKDEITGLSFSQDLTMLASASKDWTLWIWNLKERPVQCTSTFGHTRVTRYVVILLSLSLLHTHTQTHTYSYVTGAFHCASFTPDDMYVMTGCETGVCKMWDVRERT